MPRGSTKVGHYNIALTSLPRNSNSIIGVTLSSLCQSHHQPVPTVRAWRQNCALCLVFTLPCKFFAAFICTREQTAMHLILWKLQPVVIDYNNLWSMNTGKWWTFPCPGFCIHQPDSDSDGQQLLLQLQDALLQLHRRGWRCVLPVLPLSGHRIPPVPG